MKHYINNKELYCEMIISKAQGKLTKNAEMMLIILAKETISKMRYYNYKDKQDCLQNGLYQMIKNWYSFNEDKSTNTFAYFTEIFKRGLASGFRELYGMKGNDAHYVPTISLGTTELRINNLL